ncbi:MAG: hypothetical protein SVV80_13470, partial [Planctomycetota bacterium]|nr:hypothetical protein [Planctomycetota bacterium]
MATFTYFFFGVIVNGRFGIVESDAHLKKNPTNDKVLHLSADSHRVGVSSVGTAFFEEFVIAQQLTANAGYLVYLLGE